MRPRISAVVSTYNRSASLLQCLDSLEAQSLQRSEYEIVVVDDYSPDDTPNRIAERPAIRYVRQPRNMGLSASRNAGIRAACSDWILFLDDDLTLMPDVLEKHVEAHVERPGPHVAVLGHTRYASDTVITPFMQYLWDSGRSPLIDPALIPDREDVPFGFFHTNTSVNRGFLIKAGPVDESLPYGEDTELAYRLKLQGMQLIFREDIVANHHGMLGYRYACRRAKIAGRTAILTHRKHPDWIDIGFLDYSRKSRAVIALKGLLARTLDPVLARADGRRWDHPLLRRAYGFALATHQLTAMLDAQAG